MAENKRHKGHRQRMRERVQSYGLDSLAEHEALEYVLYLTNAQKDTNGIAHDLIDRFGDFAAVLEASEEELCTVEGVGPSTARMLHLLPQISRYYGRSRTSTTRCIKTTEQMGSYLMAKFAWVGQSNMAGRGDLTPENTITAPDCFMLRMGRWQPMSEPINVDRAVAEGAVPRSGANLAASFAAQLQKETGAKIGLIPCADGGTRISQWQPGEVLFDHAVFQAKLAMRTSALTAILWHQGESDCLAPEQLEAYPEQFLRTMRAFREELGDLPIVVGELGYPENGFHGTPAELLKEFNHRLPELAAQLPKCAVVSAADLTARPDGLHFTTESLRTLGLRYLEAYKSLV